jgi:putative transmembrane protein PGPGW
MFGQSRWSRARDQAVAVAGFGLIIAGSILLVLPGPGIVLILLGIGVLGREFLWARRLLDRLRLTAERGVAWFSEWFRRLTP